MRSMSRHALALALLVVLGTWRVSGQGTATVQAEPAVDAVPFEEWLKALVAEALDKGFDPALVESTLAHLEPLSRVITADRSQAELNPGFSRYVSRRLTRVMVQRGREREQEHRAI